MEWDQARVEVGQEWGGGGGGGVWRWAWDKGRGGATVRWGQARVAVRQE